MIRNSHLFNIDVVTNLSTNDNADTEVNNAIAQCSTGNHFALNDITANHTDTVSFIEKGEP